MGSFVLEDGDCFVFAGDSITDCGRRAESAPYGAGYVRMTIDLIAARYPDRNIQFFNEGIGGNTVKDLRNRWHDDVLVRRPTWLSVMIGINDLHRTLLGEPTAVPPDEYERLYREVLTMTVESSGAKLVLLDPFYISTDACSGSWRSQVLELLPEYLAVVEKLSAEFGALHVRTHAIFAEQLKYRPAETFCPEPVHPNATGHLVIAHGLLQALQW